LAPNLHFTPPAESFCAMAADPPTAMLFSSTIEPIVGLRVTLPARGELADGALVRVTRAWTRASLASQDAGATAHTARDARFGKEADSTKLRGSHCPVCGHTWRRCVMHAGVLELSAPLLNPAMHKQLVNVLRAMAPRPCESRGEGESGLLVAYSSPERRAADVARVKALPMHLRLARLRDMAGVQGRGAGAWDAGVAWRVDFSTGSATAVETRDGAVVPRHLDGAALLRLLRSLTPDDVRLMGFDPEKTDPSAMMFDLLPMLPAPACPPTMQDGRLVPHPYTSKYNRIAAVYGQSPSCARRGMRAGASPSAVAQAAVTRLINPAAMRSVRAPADRDDARKPIISLKESLERKAGAFRMEVLGKRIPTCGRAVITPDPQLRQGQVGVPRRMAERLLVQEPVNDWSRATLSALPGTVRVLTEQHTATIRAANEPMHDGCIAMRGLRDGDHVLFGRQPTLSNHSNQAYEVVVVDGDTLRFHPDCCTKFNADFDGDEMNVFPPPSYASAVELRELATLEEGLLSDATSAPVVGSHQVRPPRFRAFIDRQPPM